MYFTQNLRENWILGGKLVVDKTLRKLREATTSRTTIFVIIAAYC